MLRVKEEHLPHVVLCNDRMPHCLFIQHVVTPAPLPAISDISLNSVLDHNKGMPLPKRVPQCKWPLGMSDKGAIVDSSRKKKEKSEWVYLFDSSICKANR